MVITYYIKLFLTGADRHNRILMSLLLLVVETIKMTEVNIYEYVIFVANSYSLVIMKILRFSTSNVR